MRWAESDLSSLLRRAERRRSHLWFGVNAAAGAALAGAYLLFKTGDLGGPALAVVIVAVVAAVEWLGWTERFELAQLCHRTGGLLLELGPAMALALIELTRSAIVVFGSTGF